MTKLWHELSPSDPQYAVRLVDAILAEAVRRGTSDVHLHPRGDVYEILFRLDGVLSLIDTVSRSSTTDPVARLMVMARLPTYRSGEPMEGRLAEVPGNVEMRLGTFPTLHGQRAVVRLFAPQANLDRIDQLSLREDVALQLRQLIDCRDGAILVVGPAGSGKTTTIYAALREIAAAKPRRSVLTIEDPIESVIDGISQSQLQVTTGMTLAAALRSAVRQDPEVLLVSEIRDVETADAVLVSSLSGHLVFSTMHAADCAGALRRLVQMRLPPYLIQSGLRAVLSLRLLRRFCESCHGASEQEKTECLACGGCGYRGRVLIAECVRFDIGEVGEVVMQCLHAGESAASISRSAMAAGMVPLAGAAWRLVDCGVTDEAEVYRVLGSAARQRDAL